MVHAANIQDRDGAKPLLQLLVGRFPRLQRLWGDGAYGGRLVSWAQATGGWGLAVVKRPGTGHRAFRVVAHRWIAERTFAWLGKYRRLSKDYEASPESSEAFVYVAMIHVMLRRLAPT